MRLRRGKAVGWIIVTLLVAAGVGVFLLPRLGFLDDAGDPNAGRRVETPAPIAVEEDPAPSFEPGALKALIQKHQEKGMIPTVQAYIRWLAPNSKRIRAIKDYSMHLVKTEVVDGKLWPTEKANTKVRHSPFSVYMSFHEPKGLKGQEVIFVEGKNDGRIVGHTGGILSLVGTLRVLPNSPRAMQGNRHPVFELGLAHMFEEAVRNVPVDIERGYTEFEFKLDEKYGDRPCTLFVIKRTKQDPGDYDPTFHSDKMWIDDELLVPIFYQRYEWPAKEGEKPVMTEEYAHENVKFDNGFTDLDFDEKNPAYNY